MLGAIAGDTIGSVYEFIDMKEYGFDMLPAGSRFTDDTVMTLAVSEWLMSSADKSKDDLVRIMQEFGRKHPYAGYGSLDLLNRENYTAVIGARNCDKRGFDIAYRLGVEYAKRGDVIVSGLALGCDAAAHQGCLAARGETIAIVGNGLDITHPKENESLQKRILQNRGLLMSEQPFGIKANPTRLVARNRLQAAMSQKVLVAQCPEHSGTMHTVRFAQKYGKEIFAATYPLYNETNSGNKLLLDQQIAKPVTSKQ